MIVLAICTRERPIMLGQLLQSCVKAFENTPESVRVLIVENGPPTGAKDVVAAFSEQLDLIYVNEPRLGLVYARNAAVDWFLNSDADWLAFLDDDETIAPEWLQEMLKARETYPDTAGFFGPTHKVYPKSAPELLRAERRTILRYGVRIRRFGAGNCLVSRRMFEGDGGPHRFNMIFNLSGAEDSEFFLRQSRRGLILRFIATAHAYEDVPAARANYRFQMKKWIHQGHCAGVMQITIYGKILGRLVILRNALRLFLWGVIWFVIGGLTIVFAEKRGAAQLVKSLKFFCGAIGLPRAIWRGLGSPYATVQGQ